MTFANPISDQSSLAPLGTHGPLEPEASSAAYKQLIADCMVMEPFHGFTNLSDLPELTMEEFALITQVKQIEVQTIAAAKLALLADLQHESEIENERRAEARDADFYGSAQRMTDRERAEHDFGVRSLFR